MVNSELTPPRPHRRRGWPLTCDRARRRTVPSFGRHLLPRRGEPRRALLNIVDERLCRSVGASFDPLGTSSKTTVVLLDSLVPECAIEQSHLSVGVSREVGQDMAPRPPRQRGRRLRFVIPERSGVSKEPL